MSRGGWQAFTWSSSMSGSINNERRKEICKALGLTQTSSVTEDSTSLSWAYKCKLNDGSEKKLKETLETNHYVWSLDGETNSSQVKCLREIVQSDSVQNTNVNGSTCAKK